MLFVGDRITISRAAGLIWFVFLLSVRNNPSEGLILERKIRKFEKN